MNRFNLINIDFNSWNGFVFVLCEIEADGFDGALLGMQIYSKEKINIDFLYLSIEIRLPF